MVFPNPNRNTIEHQIGDHSDYSLTSSDPAYPGGDISAIAIARGGDNHDDPEHLYLAFHQKERATVIVSSADGGVSWSRLATLPQRVLLLTSQDSGLIALSGSAAYRIAPNGSTTELGSIVSSFRAASAARSGDSVVDLCNGPGRKGLSLEGLWPSFRAQSHPNSSRPPASLRPSLPAIAIRNLLTPAFAACRLGEGKQNLFNGIAKTRDGGRTWKIVFKESNQPAANLSATWIEERAGQGDNNIWFDTPYSLGVAPTNPDVAYATDLFRTYRTLDGGVTWQEMNSRRVRDDNWSSRGLDVTTNYGVQFDPFDSQHIYMDNTDMGLFQSTDGGQSWRSSTEGIPEDWRNTTYWLAFDPAQRGLMWGAFSGTHDLPRPKMWRNRDVRDFHRWCRRLNRWRPSLAAKQQRPSIRFHYPHSPGSLQPRREPHAIRLRLWPRRLQIH